MAKPVNRFFRVRYDRVGWFVFDEQGRRLSELMTTRGDAVIHAKELAKDVGGAQLLIHGDDDTLESEFLYMPEERHALSYDDEASPSYVQTHPTRASSPSRPSHA